MKIPPSMRSNLFKTTIVEWFIMGEIADFNTYSCILFRKVIKNNYGISFEYSKFSREVLEFYESFAKKTGYITPFASSYLEWVRIKPDAPPFSMARLLPNKYFKKWYRSISSEKATRKKLMKDFVNLILDS